MDKLKIKADFTKYIEVFLQKNAKLNLISKNDEKSMLLIMIVPYVLIYFSGIYGISRNRVGSR